MQIFQYKKNKKCEISGLSVAMGNFDGLHIGHKSVIDLAQKGSKFNHWGIITFEPHPREFFASDSTPFRLMNRTSKLLELRDWGLDVVIEIPFTEEIAKLTPDNFVNQILDKYFHLKHVVVGQNFKFGYQRKGTSSILKELCKKKGIDVTIADSVNFSNDEISSSSIRLALKDGNPQRAAQMLGRWYTIVGPVQEGDKRGRELGYPTANIGLESLNLPNLEYTQHLLRSTLGNTKGFIKP